MKHGHACVRTRGLTREYKSWLAMRRRCTEPRNASYVRYGGRGIRVCERWENSFTAFLADVGEAPAWTYQIDRIDPEGHYEPGNVRWATPEENRRTKRNRRWIVWGGARRLLIEVCKEQGIHHGVVTERLRLGWSVREAVTTPNAGRHRSRDPILRALQACAHDRGKIWSVIAKRIKRGWTVSEAFHGRPRPPNPTGPDGRFLKARRLP